MRFYPLESGSSCRSAIKQQDVEWESGEGPLSLSTFESIQSCSVIPGEINHSWRMVGGSWVSVGSSWICFLGTGQFLQNFRTFTFKNNRMLPSFAVTLNAYFYMFSIEWRMDDISSPFPWSTEPAVKKKTSGSFLDFSMSRHQWWGFFNTHHPNRIFFKVSSSSKRAPIS